MQPNEKHCKYCKETIPLSAKKCPKCGKQLYTPVWAIILIVFLAFSTLSGLFDYYSNNTISGESYSKTEKEENPCIRFMNNGLEYTKKCVNNGETIEEPEPPSKDNYEFTNWATHYHSTDGSEVFDFSEPVTKSTYVYAHYKYSPKPLPKKFELVEHYISDESNYYVTYIEGKVQYNRSDPLSYVQITFITYDSEGNTIGTCIDNNSGLAGNGTWRFKAVCFDNSGMDHYELKEITGF